MPYEKNSFENGKHALTPHHKYKSKDIKNRRESTKAIIIITI